MKNVALLVLALLLVGPSASAQENAVGDASAAFAQLQPDMTGTVSQPIMHAPAGDVLAVYYGQAPRQRYTKQDELLYIIAGHGTAQIGYPSYQLKPGSVVSIPRNSAFTIQASGRNPIKAIVIASPSNDPSDRQILDQ